MRGWDRGRTHLAWTRRCVPLAVLLLASLAHAQTVTLAPACGKSGDMFNIGGSGWPEPPPPCTYTFFFNGADFGVSPQPDGLYGPPNQSGAVVPMLAVGKYPVRIDLRLNDDNSLQGSASKDFCVVADTSGMLTAVASGTDGIDITYKPSCKDQCTKIMFIQIINARGTKTDNTEVLAVPSEWGFPADKDRDLGTNRAVDAVRVDRTQGRTQPYYGGDGTGLNNQTMGKSDGCNITNATMHDAPSQSDDSYPAGFTKRTLNFTTHPVCVAGDDTGKYYGTITWTWMKTKGGNPMVTVNATGTVGQQPSQAERDALTTWSDVHGFTLPMGF